MQDPDIEGMGSAAAANIQKLSQSIADASQAGAVLGKSLTTAFDQIVFRGKDVTDVFGSIALSMSQSVLKAALAPLQQGIGSIFSGLLGGGESIPFSHGGLLQAGTPIPFAQGGVIASPVSFPLSNGRMGLAGERGAEAIMPLARGRDGRLGVAAASGGGAPSIVVNVTATDLDSFRRSESQIAALLARAVAQGQRNL